MYNWCKKGFSIALTIVLTIGMLFADIPTNIMATMIQNNEAVTMEYEDGELSFEQEEKTQKITDQGHVYDMSSLSLEDGQSFTWLLRVRLLLDQEQIADTDFTTTWNLENSVFEVKDSEGPLKTKGTVIGSYQVKAETLTITLNKDAVTAPSFLVDIPLMLSLKTTMKDNSTGTTQELTLGKTPIQFVLPSKEKKEESPLSDKDEQKEETKDSNLTDTEKKNEKETSTQKDTDTSKDTDQVGKQTESLLNGKAADVEVSTFAEFCTAMDAAAEGDTIVIKKALTVDRDYTTDKKVTVKTSGSNFIPFTIAGAHHLSITNVKFIGDAVWTDVDGNVLDSATDDRFASYGTHYLQRLFHIKHADATLKLDGVQVTNFSFISDGGVVYAEAGKLSIMNSTINNIYEKGSVGGIFIGPASTAYLESLSNTTFEDIYAGGSGAALFRNTKIADNPIVIENCKFLNNKSKKAGGAIYLNTEKSDVRITGSTFQNNQCVNEYGGAVYLLANAEILSTEFTNNVSATSAGALSYNGNLELKAQDVTFNNNRLSLPTGIGGAIYLNGPKLATFQSSSFINNEAFKGGAIYSNTGTINMEDSLIMENNKAVQGGHIFVNNGTYTISTTATDAHITGGVTEKDGGGIYQNAGTLTLQGTSDAPLLIRKNHAGQKGGGIFANATLNMTNVSVEENDANAGGGGIRQNAIMKISGKISVQKNKQNIKDNNIFIANTKKIGFITPVSLDSESRIGVNSPAMYSGLIAGLVVTETASAIPDVANNFFSDDSTFETVYEGNVIKLKPASGVVPTPTTLQVGSDKTFTSIEDAIDASHDGDTIEVYGEVVVKQQTEFSHGLTFVGKENAKLLRDPNFHGNLLRHVGVRKLDVNISDIQFDGNSENDVDGWSLLYFNNGSASLTIQNCTFQKNRIVEEEGGAGAVYIVAGKSLIEDSTIQDNESLINNTTTRNTGGLFLLNGTSTLNRVKIIRNSSLKDGGGFRIWQSVKTVFTDCDISENTARSNGGAAVIEAYNGGAYTNFVNTRIQNNIANHNNGTGQANGGGIYVTQSNATLLFEDTSIEGNTIEGPLGTGNYGGGVYNSQFEKITVKGNTTIKGNTKTGIADNYVAANEQLLVLKDLGADASIGIATASGGKVNITAADPDSEKYAGNLFASSKAYEVAFQTDHFILQERTARLVLQVGKDKDYATIEAAYADTIDGDVIELHGMVVMENSIKLTKDIVIEDGSGQAKLIRSEKLVNHMFYNNGAFTLKATGITFDGGAKWADEKGNALESPTDEAFSQNIGVPASAFQIIKQETSKTAAIQLENCVIQNGDSTIEGGALQVNSGSISMMNTKLLNNRSAKDGGAIFMSSANLVSFISKNNVYQGNYAKGVGGAIRTNSAAVLTEYTYSNDVFEHNVSMNAGGAIYNHMANMNASTTRFENNSLIGGNGGGALVINGYTGHELSDCKFLSNTASSSGGAIYTLDKAELTITNGTFTNNKTVKAGGAISGYLINDMTVTNSEFSENSAQLDGGAINVSLNNKIELKNTKIHDNTSNAIGGGVNISAVTTTIEDTEIINNTAQKDGAGLGTLNANNVVTIKNTKINNNTSKAGAGGGIFVKQGKSFTINQNSEVAQNRAGSTGGGIYAIVSGHIEIDNIRVHDNTSNAQSGGVYVNALTTDIKDTEIINNTAKTNGGGLLTQNAGNVVTIANTKINSNIAEEGIGGGIYSYLSKSITIDQNSEVLENRAGSTGGGIHVDNAGTLLNLHDATITKNRAKTTVANQSSGYGGGIYGKNNPIKVGGNTIIKNNKSGIGGADFSDLNDDLLLMKQSQLSQYLHPLTEKADIYLYYNDAKAGYKMTTDDFNEESAGYIHSNLYALDTEFDGDNTVILKERTSGKKISVGGTGYPSDYTTLSSAISSASGMDIIDIYPSDDASIYVMEPILKDAAKNKVLRLRLHDCSTLSDDSSPYIEYDAKGNIMYVLGNKLTIDENGGTGGIYRSGAENAIDAKTTALEIKEKISIVGGHNMMDVVGSPQIVMIDGAVTTIYGGGTNGYDVQIPSGEKGNIKIKNGTVGTLFTGGLGTKDEQAVVDGDIDVAISGGTHGTISGGGNGQSRMKGNVSIALTGSPKYSKLMGGGQGGADLSKWAIVDNVQILYDMTGSSTYVNSLGGNDSSWIKNGKIIYKRGELIRSWTNQLNVGGEGGTVLQDKYRGTNGVLKGLSLQDQLKTVKKYEDLMKNGDPAGFGNIVDNAEIIVDNSTETSLNHIEIRGGEIGATIAHVNNLNVTLENGADAVVNVAYNDGWVSNTTVNVKKGGNLLGLNGMNYGSLGSATYNLEDDTEGSFTIGGNRNTRDGEWPGFEDGSKVTYNLPKKNEREESTSFYSGSHYDNLKELNFSLNNDRPLEFNYDGQIVEDGIWSINAAKISKTVDVQGSLHIRMKNLEVEEKGQLTSEKGVYVYQNLIDFADLPSSVYKNGRTIVMGDVNGAGTINGEEILSPPVIKIRNKKPIMANAETFIMKYLVSDHFDADENAFILKDLPDSVADDKELFYMATAKDGSGITYFGKATDGGEVVAYYDNNKNAVFDDDEIFFDTLEEAIKFARNDTTIAMYKDYEYYASHDGAVSGNDARSVLIDKNITLDLAGKTITTALSEKDLSDGTKKRYTGSMFIVDANITFKIKDSLGKGKIHNIMSETYGGVVGSSSVDASSAIVELSTDNAAFILESGTLEVDNLGTAIIWIYDTKSGKSRFEMNGGVLRANDRSSKENFSQQAVYLHNGRSSVVKLNKGLIDVDVKTLKTRYEQETYAVNLISSNGSLIIENDVKLLLKGKTRGAVVKLANSGHENIIRGGTLDASETTSAYGLELTYDNLSELSNVTCIGADSALYMLWGADLQIKNGVFRSINKAGLRASSNHDGTVTIEGGQFSGKTYAVEMQNGATGSIKLDRSVENVGGYYRSDGDLVTPNVTITPPYEMSLNTKTFDGLSDYHWLTQKVTLKYSSGTGSGSVPSDVTGLPGTKVNLPERGSLVAPKGRWFAGWSDGTNRYKANQEYELPEKDVTMTARWLTPPEKVEEDIEDLHSSTSPNKEDETKDVLDEFHKLTAEEKQELSNESLDLLEENVKSSTSAEVEIIVKGNAQDVGIAEDSVTEKYAVLNITKKDLDDATSQTKMLLQIDKLDSVPDNLPAYSKAVPLDIQLYRIVDANKEAVNMSVYPLNITMALPKEIDEKETIHLYRIHEGKLEELPISVDKKQRLISFSSDKFSSYIITNDPLTVSFDSNGGSHIEDITKIKAGEKIKEPISPVRKGYTFTGWYQNAELNKIWDFDKDKVENSLTLYAGWNANNYRLTYHANTGEGTVDDTLMTYDKEGKVSKNAFTKKKKIYYHSNMPGSEVITQTVDYQFKNWNSKQDGSGRTYKELEKVKNLSAKPNDKIVLYAQWVSENVILNEMEEREGYSFAGWYFDSALTKKAGDAGSKLALDDNTQLYAKWEKNDPITPVPPAKDDPNKENPNANTGDSTNLMPAIFLMVVSFVGMLVIRKKKHS